jgi:hypothetical protein
MDHPPEVIATFQHYYLNNSKLPANQSVCKNVFGSYCWIVLSRPCAPDGFSFRLPTEMKNAPGGALRGRSFPHFNLKTSSYSKNLPHSSIEIINGRLSVRVLVELCKSVYYQTDMTNGIERGILRCPARIIIHRELIRPRSHSKMISAWIVAEVARLPYGLAVIWRRLATSATQKNWN